jgi:tyrosyl-tRNA synthetase
MGKTHLGAVWLDPDWTSPYEYYQHWINQADEDIERFLALFTFLPMEEVRALGRLKGAGVKEAKEVLAYETTKICHGEAAADQARAASRQLFGDTESMDSEAAPTFPVDELLLEKGIAAYILFHDSGLCKSRGDARRLIAQGGGYLNGQRIDEFDQMIDARNMKNGTLLLRAGKKRHVKIMKK